MASHFRKYGKGGGWYKSGNNPGGYSGVKRIGMTVGNPRKLP